MNRDTTPVRLKREIAALERIAAEPDGMLEISIAGRFSTDTLKSLVQQQLVGVRLEGPHALAAHKRYYVTDAGRRALASVTVKWL